MTDLLYANRTSRLILDVLGAAVDASLGLINSYKNIMPKWCHYKYAKIQR